MTTTALLALVGSAASPALAQGKRDRIMPGQGVDWQGDWESAVAEATARNVPILVSIHKDN